MRGAGETAQEGVDLALAAHRQGLLDERSLALVLAYYDNEGASAPLPAQQVLARLGGVDPAHLRGLAPEPGRRFTDRLTLLEVLGTGGMGAVHRAHDRLLKRTVAVKLIHADKLGSEAASRYLARFEREARAMAKVRHPACVAIHDVGFGPEGQPYLIMELVEGESLAKRIAAVQSSGNPLSPREVAAWGKALAEALHACHEVGVVHRDVKPANVLLDRDGLPHLTDFGIAFDQDALTKLTASMAAIGTLAYLPPEQAGGQVVDARADVYALGMTLYEALTGRVAFEGRVALELLRQIVSAPPAPPRSLRADVPRDLELILLMCLEKEREDRYPSAQALALDLSRFLAGEPVRARPLGPLGRVGRWGWRWRRPLGVALTLTALTACSLFAWSWQRERGLREAAKARLTSARELVARTLAAQASRRPATEELQTAEAALEGLLSSAPDLAAAAREERRRLRGAGWLAQADARLEEFLGLPAHLAALADELRALEAKIDRSLPPEKNPEKRRRIQLERERERALARRDLLAAELEGLLAQATVDLPIQAIAARRARFELARGRAQAEGDPVAAEPYLRRAAAADQLAGGQLATQLALPGLRVTCQVTAQAVLSRYRFDPFRGHQVAEPLWWGATPLKLRGLEPGEYLLQLSAAGRFPLSYPLLLERGRDRKLAFDLPERAPLEFLADKLVWVPGGSPRFGPELRPAGEPAQDLLWSRCEVTVEEWRSFLVTAQLPASFRPTGNIPLDRQVRTPVAGITQAEAAAYCEWLRGEAALRGSDLRASLPSPEEFHWALRGELPWPFPWGRAFDASFCATVDDLGPQPRVGSFPLDRSPFGLLDLASSISEITRVTYASEAVIVGSNVNTVGQRSLFRFDTTQARLVARRTELPNLGLRPVLCSPRETPDDAQGGLALSTAGRPLRSSIANLSVLPQTQAIAPRANAIGSALRLATDAVRADRTNAGAWHTRAAARRLLGDPLGCLWDAGEALKLDPSIPAHWYNRALAHRARGVTLPDAAELTLALKDAEEGLRRDGTSVDGLLVRGLILADQGQPLGARRDLLAYLRGAPADGIGAKLAREKLATLR